MRFKKFFALTTALVLTLNIGITNADAKVESFDDFVKGIEREVEAVGHKSFFENFRSLSGVVEKDSDLDTTNKIHQDVENYLSEAMKRDYRLDPNLLNSLANTLDELDEKVNNSQSGLKSLQTMASRTSSSWHYGDILYYGIGNDNAAGETSFTGHTAVMTNTKYYVVEASKTRSSGAKVFHWNRNYLWSGCSGVKQYKVTDWLGNEASNSKKFTAVNYGLDQVGDPYALKTTMWDESKWYCSKLTYKQWDKAGYELSSYFDIFNGFTIVIPDAIRLDANTRLRKNWDTATPGLI